MTISKCTINPIITINPINTFTYKGLKGKLPIFHYVRGISQHLAVFCMYCIFVVFFRYSKYTYTSAQARSLTLANANLTKNCTLILLKYINPHQYFPSMTHKLWSTTTTKGTYTYWQAEKYKVLYKVLRLLTPPAQSIGVKNV